LLLAAFGRRRSLFLLIFIVFVVKFAVILITLRFAFSSHKQNRHAV
jgi:hypothetical protein